MKGGLGAVLGVGAVLAVTAPCAGQVDDSTLAVIDEFVELHRHRFGWPGAAVGIATRDSVVLARGYGEGTVAGGPITERTPFPLGSVTKTFTALAVARLAELGLIDLDAPVEAYLPDFSLRPPFRPNSISVRHLLHHRSGLSQWTGHDPRAQEEGRFDHLAPAEAAGGEAEYSSLNYIILGRIIEAVTGEGYGAHLHRILFDPLAMDDAFVYGFDDPPAGRVRGHRNLFGLDFAADEPPPPPYLVPAGFAAASARDMARYTAMLLAGGVLDDTRVLDAETVQRIFAPLDERGPAMAWGRSPEEGAAVFGHAGNARTAAARVRIVPERDYAITLLVNSNAGPLLAAPADLMEGMAVILEGETPSELWPRERLFKALLAVGVLVAVVGAGREGVRWHRANHPVGLDLAPREAGRLAFDLGGAALVIFGIPRMIGVPLPTLIEYFPDIGAGMALAAGAGALGGILRAFTASGGPTSGAR